MELERRTFLAASSGSLAAGALAGCLDDVARGSDGIESGYAAFFALWDWADTIGGDSVTFENPVGTGEVGHGWEPEADLLAEIAKSDAFVYLDLPEFAWAQEAAATLESDYETVAVIDALEGLDDELLAWNHEHDSDEHDGHDHDHEHEEDSHDHATGEGDDAENDHDHDDGGSHDGHDHGAIDPHAWVDPVLAQRIVTTIADGLADADPDNEETFRENAETYTDRLAELDDEFSTITGEAEHDVAILAGHNSYQYLEHRYDIEVHTPSGVSPQDEPSITDISETIDRIEDHDIDTILYDRFEVTSEDELPPLAETILAESTATNAVPVTSGEGTLRAWQESGWGYVEQMEELNVPAFREALGADH
ncbi:metal ABC transporter substrate-binding protein [Natrialba aegyptia]|uniref:Periplasmic solute binding protein n=1 Tax=Natrialba aegyptia DSM 13077 TaxID=1227491 RepID=M0BHI9_9EURY|nr:zinc ABC transporter substrate-binding protein [Natrialba aegyptia]ELZ10325.1 periplasmic solute binding protein [Natrialba aegyptia DSM 13077]